MSDLVGTQIVGFLMHRLVCKKKKKCVVRKLVSRVRHKLMPLSEHDKTDSVVSDQV